MLSTPPHILTINGGSSSIKFALFEATREFKEVLKGEIKRIGLPGTSFQVKGLYSEDIPLPTSDYTVALDILINWITKHSQHFTLSAIGHRIVHGGPKYYTPQIITTEMLEELRLLSPFDPEHLPKEILLAKSFHNKFPNIPQVACFDTAFHHDLPRVAKLLPIPRRYESMGIRRYGFHGLSYEFILEELTKSNTSKGKVILAHLGNGASLAAILNGKSIDTSMSFTPTSGVPMSTRSGDLDPGLLGYLAYKENLTIKEFHEMVNSKSGLLGLSETSSDMKDLLDIEEQDGRAAEAISLFCYQIKKWIGAFAATLGGLDTLVFSGGIGEKSPKIRSRICEGLEFLGIEFEEKKNEENADIISKKASQTTVRVIPTNEELMIVKTVYHLLNLKK